MRVMTTYTVLRVTTGYLVVPEMTLFWVVLG